MNERRRYARTRIDIDVDYQLARDQEWLHGRMKDLGEGGICLVSAVAFGITARIELRFRIPDTERPITVQGDVMWENFDIDRDVYLVGIQFASVETRDMELIEKFVRQETFMVV
jgi:c-di-GMP-binding flagellar brake protein YcgR